MKYLNGISRELQSLDELRNFLHFNPIVIFFWSKEIKHSISMRFFLMNELLSFKRDTPLIIGFKEGSLGTLKVEQNENKFISQYYLNDPLSTQITLHLLQELSNIPNTDKYYLDDLIISLGNYLLKKIEQSRIFEVADNIKISHFNIKRITKYIEQNIDRIITVEELSSLLNLSSFYFIRVFKLTTKITPHQYIMQIKLEKAKQMLINTKYQIIQIGLETGFENPSHFSKVFKEFYGITPLRYKKFIQSLN